MKKTVLFLVLNIGFVTANAQTLIGNFINGSFGQELSLDIAINSNGDRLMFGMPDYPNNNNGIVSEYSLSSSWYAVNVLDNEPIEASRFGTSLSISNNGNRIAIGAPFHWYHQPYNIGRVYVYDYDASTTPNWQQVGNVIEGVNAKDLFGEKISLSSDGNRLAVSGYLADINGITDSGLVRVFQFNSSNSQWEQMGNDFYDTESANEYGRSCVLSKDGSTLVIGSPGKSSGYGETSVYRWSESGSIWEQVGATLIGDNSERLGTSLVVNQDGTLLTIGCVNASVSNVNYIGRVRTFKLISGSWVEFSTSLFGENQSNYFGYNLSMSDDGTVLAVAAIGWQSFRGRVYVYSLVGNEWVQKTFFEGTSNSRLGDALSLTSDGNRIALGSKPNGSYRVMAYDITNVLNANQFVTENTKIYPNPTKEKIIVFLNNSLEFINSRIYNAMGQLVKESKSKEINVQHLSKGLYFVEVETSKGKGVQKFIKE
ncbi:T9SS type A sorting domain-containing protein [Flavobacterium jejuense]|uniref:T9SS type A sorting domain-containing protein n=1 Tax=Flavobacterium jejuense TaxID=1544455 RepID=A0ABX0IXU2_9FLAO|nr:T9SS type A sorting domain-containing protein [Flavobacterium jejuense]NHN26565.1 T9SS type A sorting domain-containing protein [Flavobacterium jejuense]